MIKFYFRQTDQRPERRQCEVAVKELNVGAYLSPWSHLLTMLITDRPVLCSGEKKKKKIYLPSESHIKLNQINAKGGLPEEQTLINAGRPYHIIIM